MSDVGNLKDVMRCRTLGVTANKILYEGVVVETILLEAETLV